MKNPRPASYTLPSPSEAPSGKAGQKKYSVEKYMKPDSGEQSMALQHKGSAHKAAESKSKMPKSDSRKEYALPKSGGKGEGKV